MNIDELNVSGAFAISFEMADKKVGWRDLVVDYDELYKLIKFRPIIEFTTSIPFKHTVRGLYYQEEPFGQAMLITSVSGKALVIVADIREDSPTYQKWDSVSLIDGQINGIFIPSGCAVGIVSKTNDVLLNIRADSVCSADYERTLNIMDPSLDIKLSAQSFGIIDESEDDYFISIDRYIMSNLAIISIKDKVAPWLSRRREEEQLRAKNLKEKLESDFFRVSEKTGDFSHNAGAVSYIEDEE